MSTGSALREELRIFYFFKSAWSIAGKGGEGEEGAGAPRAPKRGHRSLHVAALNRRSRR